MYPIHAWSYVSLFPLRLAPPKLCIELNDHRSLNRTELSLWEAEKVVAGRVMKESHNRGS